MLSRITRSSPPLDPWRRVRRVELVSPGPRGGRRWRLVLVCGHHLDVSRRRRRVRCPVCGVRSFLRWLAPLRML